MSRTTEAAIRRTGALVALAAASAIELVLFVAVNERTHGVLALYAVLLLGLAAVLLSPAHRAVADLARWGAEAAREIFRAAEELRWVGFTGIVFYAAYASGNVQKEAAADMVNGFLLFLLFLAGVWTAYMSMVTGRGPPPHRAVAELARRAAEVAREIFSAAGREAEELRWVGFTGIVFYAACMSGNVQKEAAADMDNGFLLFLLFLAGVWTVYLSMVTGRGPPPHRAVAELARRAAEAAREIFHAAGRAAEVLRWVGFTGIVFYAAYVSGNVQKEAAADMDNSFLLFLLFLAGVCTVYLSMVTGRSPPPHRAVSELARRAAEAAREIFHAAGRAAEELRWVGFTGIVFYAAYMSGNVQKLATVDMVTDFLLFLLFLAGVWTVYLSMVTGRCPRPAKVLVDKINVFLLFLLFLAGVWTVYVHDYGDGFPTAVNGGGERGS